MGFEDRHEYPDRNRVLGVEDPAQAWNALTVGASTDLMMIQQEGYDGWNVIARAGRLSPSSRTSLVWSDKTWPLKPDIVMEGETARSIRILVMRITSMTWGCSLCALVRRVRFLQRQATQAQLQPAGARRCDHLGSLSIALA